eukprot:scaffold115_cov241-Pinguiococcus_pyrenoidosus.AAC.18
MSNAPSGLRFPRLHVVVLINVRHPRLQIPSLSRIHTEEIQQLATPSGFHEASLPPSPRTRAELLLMRFPAVEGQRHGTARVATLHQAICTLGSDVPLKISAPNLLVAPKDAREALLVQLVARRQRRALLDDCATQARNVLG